MQAATDQQIPLLEQLLAKHFEQHPQLLAQLIEQAGNCSHAKPWPSTVAPGAA